MHVDLHTWAGAFLCHFELFFFPILDVCSCAEGFLYTSFLGKKKVFCIDFLHISLDKSQKIKGGHILLLGQNSRSLFWTLFWELSSNVNKEVYIQLSKPDNLWGM
jgi:hypothetical protein